MMTSDPLPPPQPGIARPVVPMRPPFPTIGQAILLTLLLMGAQLIAGALLMVIGQLLGLSRAERMGAGAAGVANVLSSAAVFGIGLYWGKLPIRQALPLRPIPITLLLPLIFTVVGLSVLMSDVNNLVLFLLPPPDFVSKIFDELTGSEGQKWQSVVLLAVIAPLTEEPIFRGLMLNGLLKGRSASGGWVAVFVTAILFAVTHFNPWQFPMALAAGLLHGWWFLRTRSLWPCILGHAINNSLGYIVSTIPGFDVPGYTGAVSDSVVFQPLWFDLAGLAAFVVGLAWTWREFRRMLAPPIARPVIPSASPVEPLP